MGTNTVSQNIGDQRSRRETPPLDELLQPPFKAHPWVRGPHLQTLLSLRARTSRPLSPKLLWVPLDDGDRLAVQDDVPTGWKPGDASLLLIHGLCGCSESPYMLRLAARFVDEGVRVFRLNLRGCGLGRGAASQITHAGRSRDVAAVLSYVARLTEAGPLCAAGISLGGNQLLRALAFAALDIEEHFPQQWLYRMERCIVISPPIDLVRCSNNMQRLRLRPYNRFFIRRLLRTVPDPLKNRLEVLAAIADPPRTMRQLDERVTAPLGGFDDAMHYYETCAANRYLQSINVPTLILAAADDPIVPASCFSTEEQSTWSNKLRLVMTPSGGHVGFISRMPEPHWMDGLLSRWFQFDRFKPTHL